VIQEDGESVFNPNSSKVVSLEMTADGDIMLAD